MTPTSPANPGLKHLVLLGAGHAHVHVLQGLAKNRPENLRITVIAPYPRQLYSGMVPGFVAGHYTLDQCVIPLAGLLARCEAHYVEDSAVAIDVNANTVTLASGNVVAWDWLSLNTGPVMDRDAIESAMPGARENALFVRPIETFGALWPRLAALAQSRPIELAVIGAGAAGLELAMAAAYALRGAGYPAGSHVTLVTGGPPPASGYSSALQRRVLLALQRQHVTVVGEACVGMVAGELLLENGARLACDAPVLAVGAQSPRWLAGSGLALDEAGFVAVNNHLQSTSHAQVFAVGDVASRVDVTHPRSGVYAVRAGPPLLANLKHAVLGEPLSAYQPPARTLNLIACGERYAIAAWGSLHVEGHWVWRLKDRIDRGFVARYGI